MKLLVKSTDTAQYILSRLLQMNCSHDREQESEAQEFKSQKMHNHRKPSSNRDKVQVAFPQPTTPVKSLLTDKNVLFIQMCYLSKNYE